jgi:disulfide bond formation protein DsbB
MSADTFQLFFTLLALGSNVAAVMLIVTRLGSSRSAPLRAIADAVGPVALPLAAIVAVVTMAGSLYFSEVAHYVPCPLCWLQRAVAYPVAVILLIAAFRRDVAVRVYVIPLVAIGTLISTYHWLLERYPQLETSFCSTGASCAAPWFTRMGFVTLAYMAFSSFLLIASLLALPPRESS